MATEPGTIVVIEDDPNIADLVEMYLRRDGFRVIQATTGESGLAACDRESPRLVVLDVGLPGEIDGFEVCRRLRSDADVAIVMLTARDDEIDRVLGLELGADDYVTKPFSPRELAARVKAVLRRSDRPPASTPRVLAAGGVEVDAGRREARVDGRASSRWQPASSTCCCSWLRTSAWPCRGSRSSTAPGVQAGSATNGRSTCTSASSARSWAMPSRWQRCGASDTGWGEMRRRLTVSMVLMVFGALVLAGLASLALSVHDAGIQTRRELVREAQGLASTVQTQANTTNPVDPAKALHNLLGVMRAPLRLQGSAVVGVRPRGVLFDPVTPRLAPTLPSGLSAADLRPQDLLALSTVSGTTHGFEYAAAPYRANLQVAGDTVDVVQAVVLTRSPPGVLRSAGPWFALSSLVILGVAFLVANRLGRRLARPLEAAQTVTRRIAGGDLDARVPEEPGADSEMASLAASINAMADSLARAQGAERQFLLSVSHDLRTPLTSIKGFAEAIEDGMVADVGAAAGVIASESRRLERLVNDLLALATLEARRFALMPQRLDLAAATSATVAGFAPAAAELGLSLAFAAEPAGEVEATADPDRVAQVAANLIENALRFATREVRVVVTRNGDGPELWVEDDGPGISAQDMPRVFERLFASGPRPGRQISSGLGLAIVAELVTAMGGSVRAESPLGPAGGTRMVVGLPG